MKEYIKFITDKRFLIPLAILTVIEIFLQTGVFRPYLKKNSYASNINRITDHILSHKEDHNPDILILGTSVAYQGLSPRILQEKLNGAGLKIQSAAVPGSELIVQELVSEKILRKFDKVKLLVYVAETTMPWGSQWELGLPTLAMVGEFDKIDFYPKVKNYGYNVHYDDWVYLMFKSVAYRRDIGDFLTDPGKRMKQISKLLKSPNKNFYDFENDHFEKVSSYPAETLEECIKKTENFGAPPYPDNSNPDHKKAVLETCALAKYTRDLINDPHPKKKEQAKKNIELYFQRFRKVYEHYRKRNIKFLIVFAPYSHLMKDLGGDDKVNVWKQNLEGIIGKENLWIADMQDTFDGKDSNDFCYDTIHLNHQGMELFSEKLGNFLLEKENLKRILDK